ncbi:MAG TPA: hypothetical protein VMV69_00980 [Pirellulales bacterium]|nr:hypothetical protein [Pirellulales bacterium]
MPVGHILLAGRVEPLVVGMLRKVELDAVRVDSAADGLAELLPADVDLPRFHHLVGAEAVQVRVGDFPHQLIQGFLRLETARLDVLEVVEDVVARESVVVAKDRNLRVAVGFDDAFLDEDAEPAFELLRHGSFEQLSALRHDAAELVADGLVHRGVGE